MAQVSNNKSFKSIVGVTLIAAALGLTACSTPVDPDVKARQDTMKSWGDAMGIMATWLKRQIPLMPKFLKSKQHF